MDNTSRTDSSVDLKKGLEDLFRRIDESTNDVLDFMREKGFSREGLQMVMLGLPNELYLNGKVPKKIDHGTLGTIEIDAPCPGRSYNVVNLKIIAGGITQCLNMENPSSEEEQARLTQATHSTVNEIALYKALAQTARSALGNDKTEAQEATVKTLENAVAELDALTARTFTFTPEMPFSLWKKQIDDRADAFAGYFEQKRVKPQVTQPNRDGVIDLNAEKQKRSGIQ